MCGIAGFWDLSGDRRERGYLEDAASKMAQSIIHRGPDGSGVWLDPEHGLGLSHRRLAIIDLSASGAQPMHSGSGRYCMVYNGEVYNFRELRRELEGRGARFAGHSDTEVVLNAFDVWGIDQALQRFTGMFAMAVWDRQVQQLTLIRDRLGEKPLYYGLCGDIFLFGSELKALGAHPRWRPEIDRHSLTLFFRHNYIPEPFCIYKNIHKLRPGHLLRMGRDVHGADSEELYSRGSRRFRRQHRCFWSMRQTADSAVRDKRSKDQALSGFEDLMLDVVEKQMIADVPLGALLSGGMDSSTIAALMQNIAAQPIKTFTIGFDEADHNEAEHAAAVAAHLGTEHHELYVTPKQTLDVVARLPLLYDEPFSDSSQIPTWLVSLLVREHVTVCLSGDGGDELFAGYSRYAWMRSIWKSIGWMPPPMRAAAAAILRKIPRTVWEILAIPARPLLRKYSADKNIGHKIHRLADILGAAHKVKLYQLLVSHWDGAQNIVVGGREPPTIFDRDLQIGTLTETMMYLDTVSYLPGDILTKVDRASMGASLEVRVPFLDHRVVEYVWRLPEGLKIRNRQSKWLLRELLTRHVPDKLIDRPKMGFGVPIEAWLRGPLRDWAEDLLDAKTITDQGVLRAGPIRQKWREHLAGERNWQYHLWDVLMFQSWYRVYA